MFCGAGDKQMGYSLRRNCSRHRRRRWGTKRMTKTRGDRRNQPVSKVQLGPNPILKNPKPTLPRPVLFTNRSGPVPSILGLARPMPTPN
ncbi:hypothetical protein C1H46_011955 [Malus baccata]|uniref:Uncharacterized protein n=1 Tax=Malus baccata TaxID=106549 RepID=A0A540MVP9_MALBA|nr:hypothetical protein C1H46_011955 [Malus baccata]